VAEPIRITVTISSSLHDVAGVNLVGLGEQIQTYAENLVVDNTVTKNSVDTVVHTYVSVNEAIAPGK